MIFVNSSLLLANQYLTTIYNIDPLRRILYAAAIEVIDEFQIPSIQFWIVNASQVHADDIGKFLPASGCLIICDRSCWHIYRNSSIYTLKRSKTSSNYNTSRRSCCTASNRSYITTISEGVHSYRSHVLTQSNGARPLQPPKAPATISFTLLPNTTSLIAVFFWNQLPTFEQSIVTRSRPVQPSNAALSTSVTFSSNTISFIEVIPLNQVPTVGQFSVTHSRLLQSLNA